MKKVVAAVGLAASGIAGLHAATLLAPSDASKPFTATAVFRGFYDDNVNTVPNNATNKTDSFGFEINPIIGKVISLETTTLSLGYEYSFKYYDQKPSGNTDNYDQTHTFDLGLDHAFNPLYQLGLRDSFVIGQEPDQLRTDFAISAPHRISGDNIRNYGEIKLTGTITRELGFEAGYGNSLWDYHDNSFTDTTTFTTNLVFAGTNVVATNYFGRRTVSPSLSGVLDRVEHSFHLDGTYVVQPQTIARVGYRFTQINYTADQPVGAGLPTLSPIGPVTPGVILSDNRDLREHTIYVGATHTFRPDLTASAAVGGSYIDPYKDITSAGTDIAPYADVSLNWTYSQSSYVQASLKHDINATDVAGSSPSQGKITLDAESTTFRAEFGHRITPKLQASISGELQNSTFNGGINDNQSEIRYLLGLKLNYAFNPHFGTEVGYNYDKLDSDIANRGFDRNRVYIGFTASY